MWYVFCRALITKLCFTNDAYFKLFLTWKIHRSGKHTTDVETFFRNGPFSCVNGNVYIGWRYVHVNHVWRRSRKRATAVCNRWNLSDPFRFRSDLKHFYFLSLVMIWWRKDFRHKYTNNTPSTYTKFLSCDKNDFSFIDLSCPLYSNIRCRVSIVPGFDVWARWVRHQTPRLPVLWWLSSDIRKLKHWKSLYYVHWANLKSFH